MRRTLGLLVALLLVGPVLAPISAYAQKPQHFVYRYVYRSACDFPVSIRIEGKFSVKEFKHRSGHFSYKRIETSPGVKETFTNLESGKTVRYTIAGPGITKVERGGASSVADVGPWGWDSNPVTDGGGLWITRGRWYATYDNRGKLSSFKFSGHLIDVCEALT